MKNNTNIIQIAPYFVPHLGGMEYRAKEIANMLSSEGYNVETFTSDIGSYPHLEIIKKNLKTNYLKSFEIAHTPISFELIYKLFKIPKKSIIYLHISNAYFPEIAYLISKIRNIPYIAHIHLDISGSGLLGFLLPAYKKYFLKKVLQNAKKIIVLTKDYKELISKKYDISPEKIKIIPNSTNFKIKRKKVFTLHKPIRLLFVGRLAKQKNIPLLIDTFKIEKTPCGLAAELPPVC